MAAENGTASGSTGRRPLLKLAVGGAALTTVGVAARLKLYAEDGPAATPDGALALSTHGGSDVQSLHLELGDDFLLQTGPGRWESRRLPTSTHSMVAFTWAGDRRAPVTSVRSRSNGAWGPWVRVPLLLDLPDDEPDDEEAVRGTDLVWIGRADGVQVRVEGRRPPDLALVLLYPARRPGDALVAGLQAGRTVQESAEDGARVPRPALVTRKEWGADESLRNGDPTYNHTIKQVHVHHTVNANNYSREDVPALVRGMYAYHTQSLGWSDIGYNFLVDKFGRGFVGRAGGPNKLVRGAHTLGFNSASTGISAIGNYETTQPTDALLDTIASIAAWKLDPFDRDPRGTIRVESEGSDKYPSGRKVRLPVIDGHRDTNDTACPGGHLYDALPKIRRRAERAITAAQARPIVVEEPAAVTGVPRLGETLTIMPGIYQPTEAAVTYQWLRGDEQVPGADDQTYVLGPVDVGTTLTCLVTLAQPDVESVVQRTPAVGPVTAPPVLVVAVGSRRRVARVRVSVAPPAGVGVLPTGEITVTVGDRVKVANVVDGHADVQFGRGRRMTPGQHTVHVVYPGDATFIGGEWSGGLRIG